MIFSKLKHFLLKRLKVFVKAVQLVCLLERRVAQALSLRKKFLYDLSLVEEGEEEEKDR